MNLFQLLVRFLVMLLSITWLASLCILVFFFTSLFGQEESGADIFFWTCACRVPLESLNFGNVPAVLLGIAGHLI